MILLKVLSYNGAPVEDLAATFDELGGSIGRADGNQLVLPDPDRTVSRVHASISFRAGGYRIVDNGSNPISVNGQLLGGGREHLLRPGDQLAVGGYVLLACEASAPRTSDPFADLFGDTPGGLALAPQVPAAPPVQAAGFPGPAAATPGGLAFGTAAAGAARPQAGATPPPAAGASLIPDDWDPFAPDPVPAAAPATAPGARRDVFDTLPQGQDDSLDALFGLAPGAPVGDPLGGSPAQAVAAQPNTASHADALQSLLGQPLAAAPSRSDHVSDLHLPFDSPPARPLPPAPAVPAAPAPAPPPGAVFSWDGPAGATQIIGGSRSRQAVQAAAAAQAASAPPLAVPTAPGPAAAPSPAVPPAPATASAPAAAPLQQPTPWPAASTAPAAATPPQAAAQAELLAALLAGLQAPHLRLDSLTPQTMRLLGELLRQSMHGTVELLVARAAFKREMRAEMTTIVARENNPLKFSPTVDVALQHLLGPPVPGFQPPVDAVRDAFDDLRAHQLGVMAGMRAALDGVLGRFDPQQLEAKLTRKSALDSLLPSGRKARLWELFTELFSQLQAEAQDDFDVLFGKAFLQAYEEQLDRLHAQPPAR